MACLAATLWGTWPLYAHAGTIDGLPLAFLTMLAMALPAPFVLRRAQLADRGATVALIVVGLADATNAVLYFSALARGPVVVATLTHYLAPLLVALVAPLLLTEPRSKRALLAAPVVLAGLGLVLARASTDGDWVTTALLGAGSAVFYATLVIASRKAARAYPPLALTSVHAVVSVAALLVVFGARALPTPSPALAVTALGCLVNGLLAAVLFNVALQRIGAQLTGVLTYLEPLTASLVGVVAFHEPAGLNTLLGTLTVLAAGAWVALERPRAG
jgi:drug/metabolite transporter (DMT)-like permease